LKGGAIPPGWQKSTYNSCQLNLLIRLKKWVERLLTSPNGRDYPIIAFLIPFSFIYCLIATFRFLFSRFKIFRNRLKGTSRYPKIISVGNIVVGGSGKTPVTIALARHLSKKWKVGVVIRGYQRKGNKTLLLYPENFFKSEDLTPFKFLFPSKNSSQPTEFFPEKERTSNSHLATNPIRKLELERNLKDKPNFQSKGYQIDSFFEKESPTSSLTFSKPSLSPSNHSHFLDPFHYGDEPIEIFKLAQVPVAVAVDRLDGIKKLAQIGVEVIILDDGFHKPIKKLEIVIDKPIINPFCLPAGGYRLPRFTLKWADIILKEGVNFFRKVEPVTGDILVSGIANPNRLLKWVEVKEVRFFPDHHQFQWEDVADLEGKIVVTTGKDYPKLAHFPLNLKIIPLQIELGAEVWKKISNFLED